MKELIVDVEVLSIVSTLVEEIHKAMVVVVENQTYCTDIPKANINELISLVNKMKTSSDSLRLCINNLT